MLVYRLDCHRQEDRDVEGKDRSFRRADSEVRQRDRAHRRYLASLKALAAVRKLPIVAVQVNVGAEAGPTG